MNRINGAREKLEFIPAFHIVGAFTIDYAITIRSEFRVRFHRSQVACRSSAKSTTRVRPKQVCRGDPCDHPYTLRQDLGITYASGCIYAR